MRKSIRMMLLPAITALALAGVTAPADASGVTVIDVGHVDVFGVAFEDGELNLHAHDEDNDIEYAPEELLLVAKSESRTTVPNDPAFGFLGDPGDPVWVLPELQDPNLLWPGHAAEEVEPGVFVNDELQIRVLAKVGPGDFSIFSTGSGTPTVLVDSGNGLPDTLPIGAGVHSHANWAFEAAGHYFLLVVVTGVLAETNERIWSNVGLYHFRVRS